MMQDPNLVPECRTGLCQVVDLQTLDLTACSSDSDCRIRTRDCCECGGGLEPEDIIAIRVDAESAYSALACDPGTACPECAPTYPPSVIATCSSGRCTARWSR